MIVQTSQVVEREQRSIQGLTIQKRNLSRCRLEQKSCTQIDRFFCLFYNLLRLILYYYINIVLLINIVLALMKFDYVLKN